MFAQQAHTNCIDNMMKITAGLTRLIQLERYSGGRPWGLSQSKPANITYIKGLENKEDGDGPKKAPRKLTKEELQNALEQYDD